MRAPVKVRGLGLACRGSCLSQVAAPTSAALLKADERAAWMRVGDLGMELIEPFNTKPEPSRHMPGEREGMGGRRFLAWAREERNAPPQ